MFGVAARRAREMVRYPPEFCFGTFGIRRLEFVKSGRLQLGTFGIWSIDSVEVWTLGSLCICEFGVGQLVCLGACLELDISQQLTAYPPPANIRQPPTKSHQPLVNSHQLPASSH